MTTKQKPEAAQVIADTCNKLHVPCVVSDPDEAVLEKRAYSVRPFLIKERNLQFPLPVFTRKKMQCWH